MSPVRPHIIIKRLHNKNMDNTLQINSIKRTIGELYMQVGIKNISNAISDFSDTQGTFARFCKPMLGLPVSQLDDIYYFTSYVLLLRV